MSHKKHLSEEATDAAVRFGAFGALISGSIAAGQSVSLAQQGVKSAPDALTDTFAAAAKGGLAAAVGGAAAAAVGGHGFSRFASFLAGTAAAAWVLSPRKGPKAIAHASRDEAGGNASGEQTPKPSES